MKIEIRLTDAEYRRLMRLAFLGNYVVNGCKSPDRERGEYSALAEKLYRLWYGCVSGIAAEDAEENEIADIRDGVYDEVCGELEAFERDIRAEAAADMLAADRFRA